MALKLYVDVLTDDGKIAMVTNHFMISRNAESLQLVYKKDDKVSPIIAQAGRYVCFMMFASLNEFAMFFMDFKKNRELALYTSEQYKDSSTQKVFMEVFEKVSKEYDERYHEVQLMLDINFIPNIIEN